MTRAAAAVVRLMAIRRRNNGLWDPPGGILYLDETIDEGLAREVSEETGLLAEIDYLTGVYKNMTRASSPWSSDAASSAARPVPQPRHARLPG